MQRRFLLLGVFTATACASTPEPIYAPSPAAVGATPVAATAPAPRPYVPAPTPVALPGEVASPTASSFERWLYAFRTRAAAAGISRATLDRELNGLTPDPSIARLDNAQPEFSKPVSQYVTEAVTPGAVAEGARLRAAAPWLSQVEAKYGVPSGILVGIWGRETGYGKILGPAT
jgi:membrane-bound lytic murein transglycosylase B